MPKAKILLEIEKFELIKVFKDCIKKMCEAEIQQFFLRNKLPIIVGGTGLYVKSLLEGYSLGTAANNEFREKYQKLAEINGNKYVWNILNEISPEKAKTVHFQPVFYPGLTN